MSVRNRLTIIAAALALTVAAVLTARSLVFSDDGAGIVNPEDAPTLPFPGYPTTTGEPPDLNRLPTCIAPKGDQPTPGVPPLSCRPSDSEPPVGAIKTPAPDELPDPTATNQNVPKDWTVIDNRLFRFTLAVPADWYSNMRPEGGSFDVFDPIQTAFIVAKGQDDTLHGGVAGSFTARPYIEDDGSGFRPSVERRLESPNADFGRQAGSIWDEPGEDTVVSIHAAFVRDGVVYEIIFDVADRGRAPETATADVGLVRQILTTLQPY